MTAPLPSPDRQHLRHFGFLPLPQFTMLSFMTAIEVLRMANHLLGQPYYRWSVVSTSSGPVVASNGLTVHAGVLNDADPPDAVFVCGGTRANADVDHATLQWLQHLAARDVTLGSLCTGTRTLLRAGLLNGYTCASHWEDLVALQREFPKSRLSQDLFVIDRDRITCTGGTAPLDLMLNLVGESVGAGIVALIANQFTIGHVRDHKDKQRMPASMRMPAAHPALAEVIALMEVNLKEPLSLDELAHLSGASQRQLQRLFREHLGTTPKQHYLSLRLRHARALLRQTPMSITSITSACGFQSACHFSKTYRALYGAAPSSERRNPQSFDHDRHGPGRLPGSGAGLDAGLNAGLGPRPGTDLDPNAFFSRSARSATQA
ncbi:MULTISPECIES: GlxA family transcriptional regulator [Achromobacter]|uniref:GlxA family transcriptional regulator n=1 Tax=Achromobacter spanius TaxID=217203 RepID=A0ABY8GSS3_9BURK|nr:MULTISPECIES: GlxA family transcriptional regulator [Achromobacter]WAI83178.1 GlxA family transcriptional regulator [Achromobacter spanius]WEX93263.1 GlxA family transcriptional regulator [Achromobacter sp. SS2-2022]WFP07579.1 GlxA family transcriptional regulator [Achromobacter spanius]